MGIRARDVIIIVVIALLFFTAGFFSGVKVTVSAGIKVARSFVNVTVDDGRVQQALFMYDNNIGTCFPQLK